MLEPANTKLISSHNGDGGSPRVAGEINDREPHGNLPATRQTADTGIVRVMRPGAPAGRLCLTV
jgi:hypothetical protein